MHICLNCSVWLCYVYSVTDISRWFVERREESYRWTGALCPRKENIWSFWRSISRLRMVQQCPTEKFEVLVNPSAEVDLTGKTCSCYQLQVCGFPYVHATAVIIRIFPTVYSIVEDFFFTKTYRKCYSYDIHAIPKTEKFEFQSTLENSDKIHPPVLNRKPGWPKEKESHRSVSSKRRRLLLLALDVVTNHDPAMCFITPEEAMCL